MRERRTCRRSPAWASPRESRARNSQPRSRRRRCAIASSAASSRTVPGTTLNGDPKLRVPNTTNISFDGIEAESLLIALDLEGVAVSTGSACSSGSLEPSHVLRAMGGSHARTRNSLRFSLGPENTAEEVDFVLGVLPGLVTRLRGLTAHGGRAPLAMRIVVAMSGGVDSSVAASLLAEAGHDVIGLSMQLYDQRESPEAFGSCCSLDDSAGRPPCGSVHRHPALPGQLRGRVPGRRSCAISSDEYAVGPHADSLRALQCRSEVRAPRRARRWLRRRLGRDRPLRAVAFDEDRRGFKPAAQPDADKDQSYFLFSLTQDQLAHAVFPVGHLTKPEVRAHAARLGLAVAEKPDSHEICFVPDGDAAGFVERQMPDAPRGGDRLSIRPAACSDSTRACIASRSVSGRASAWPPALRSTC